MNNLEPNKSTANSDDAREKELAEPLDQLPSQPPVQTEQISPERFSRFGRVLRSALRWAVGLLIVFAFGVGATWFTRVRHQSQEIQNLGEQLTTANSEVDRLSIEVEDLRPLVAENTNLEKELAKAELHVDLLDIFVDLTSAQLSLVEDNPLATSAALEGLDIRLEDLQKRLPGEGAPVIRKMQERLQLVMDELEVDAFAAKRDLEILSNDLLSLESVIFDD